jgi:triacylglycerol esterase/lipase EstA (alpha/beta hydrolase family)
MHPRTMLRTLLLVQAAAALLIGVVLAAGGMPAWQAAIAAFGAVVLVRLAINLNNFVLAARADVPAPHDARLGPLGWLRLLAGEFGASMLASHWTMVRARPGRIHPAPHAGGMPPVLLLHGYGATGGYWARLAPLLDAAGISHASVDLAPVAAGIDDYVPAVEAAVAGLCAATGAPHVAIVAHSMGGLVARAWMRTHGTARLARLVTLGTPHYGTALARFGPGENARQMRGATGELGGASAWLRALDAGEDPAARPLITSIYTRHDNIVAPRRSGALPGARNIALAGVGHVALGGDARVLALVMRELAALAPAAAVTAPSR